MWLVRGVRACVQQSYVVGHWSCVWPCVLCVKEGVTVEWGCVLHGETVVGGLSHL